MNKAVILLSGGLDSTTCLAIAKSEGYALYALSVNYGQKKTAELHAAARIAHAFGVQAHRIVNVPDIGAMGGSALTDATIDVPEANSHAGIAVTYVPARNTIMLSIAFGFAEIIGARDVFIGVSSVDYSGYPDCRPEYIEAFQAMANLSNKCGVEGDPIRLRSPLLHLSKAETIARGKSLGVDYALTVTCYAADDLGRACGRCDSCYLRRQGFLAANVDDPTRYQF